MSKVKQKKIFFIKDYFIEISMAIIFIVILILLMLQKIPFISIIVNISYSIIASIFFYVLIVFIPKRRAYKNYYLILRKKTNVLLIQLRKMFKFVGVKDMNKKISKNDFITICRNRNLDVDAGLFHGDSTYSYKMKTGEAIFHYYNNFLSFSENIIILSNIFDSEVFLIISKFISSTWTTIYHTLNGDNTNATLKAYAEHLYIVYQYYYELLDYYNYKFNHNEQ